ncbi:MAG TPA: CapA family protein [Gallionella sp.]|nr:CapA family protein [Gallionella sp.]
MNVISIPLLAILWLTLPAAAQSTEFRQTNPETSEPVSSSSAAESTDLVVCAVGDIMLDGTARPVMAEQGYDYPFVKMLPYFNGAQIIFGNVEGPLTDRGTPEDGKTFVFRSPPDKVGAALRAAGFNVVSLANNHTLDYGADGLIQTIETLDAAGILHAGAGADLMAARQPALIQVNGLKVAILAYSMTLPESFFAGPNKAGTAFGHESQVSADVMAARKQADIVLVSFHWGQEGKTALRDYQTHIGHSAIDAGAHVVIGHHPHILQGIEQYKDGVILYSLGNFTFGSYSMNSARSAVAQLRFHNARLQSVRLFPINVNNFEIHFQPQPLTGAAADAVIDELSMLSASLNTRVNNDNGTGLVTLEETTPAP